MRSKTVEVTLIDGTVWFVPESEFIHFNVPEDPIAILSNYVRGSRGPFIHVTNEQGEKKHINAHYIVSAKVTYND